MIRPIEIHIKDNKIELVEIEHRSAIDDIYELFSDKYLMLTPGFIDHIIFRNSNVTGVEVLDDNKSMGIYLDRFEVKEGHPENTKFESIDAMDCVMIFHDVVIQNMLLQNLHNPDEPDKQCERALDVVPEYLENAVITEWKVTDKKADFVFATGVQVLKMSFKYGGVMLGWNKTNK